MSKPIPPAAERIAEKFGTYFVASDDLSPPWHFVTKHPLAVDVAQALVGALQVAGFTVGWECADPTCDNRRFVFMHGPQRFKWTIEIEVDETWVGDGFDLTDERATDLVGKSLAWASSHEYTARVVSRPADEDIARAQGYTSVEEWRHVNGRQRIMPKQKLCPICQDGACQTQSEECGK